MPGMNRSSILEVDTSSRMLGPAVRHLEECALVKGHREACFLPWFSGVRRVQFFLLRSGAQSGRRASVVG